MTKERRKWTHMLLITAVGPLIGRAFPLLPQPSHRLLSCASATALFGVVETTTKTRTSSMISRSSTIIKVGDCIGSGSYGTVHFLQVLLAAEDTITSDDSDNSNNNDATRIFIGKRPWTEQELWEKSLENSTDSSSSSGNYKQAASSNQPVKKQDFKERAARCLYYWQVEEHCFSRLPSHPQLPPYYGTISAGPGETTWMVFGIVGDDTMSTSDDDDDHMAPKTALCLSELMKLDLEEQKHYAENGQDKAHESAVDWRHMRHIAEALQCTTDGETLDRTLDSILTVLEHVHSHQIVHRDIKPSNLLVHDGSLIVLDFGSAADLKPDKYTTGAAAAIFGGGTRYWGLEDKSRVAVSPIYCAPEVFVDLQNAPLAFDLFSSALLFCQLLFGFLEERVDAGFHQQLQDASWDLNSWLSNELGSKLRPEGLERALEYLGERPGLWTLLQALLQEDPTRRPTASEAKKRLQTILEEARNFKDQEDYNKHATLEKMDGPFFAMIITAFVI